MSRPPVLDCIYGPAADLICACLDPLPASRPPAHALLVMPFLTMPLTRTEAAAVSAAESSVRLSFEQQRPGEQSPRNPLESASSFTSAGLADLPRIAEAVEEAAPASPSAAGAGAADAVRVAGAVSYVTQALWRAWLSAEGGFTDNAQIESAFARRVHPKFGFFFCLGFATLCNTKKSRIDEHLLLPHRRRHCHHKLSMIVLLMILAVRRRSCVETQSIPCPNCFKCIGNRLEELYSP